MNGREILRDLTALSLKTLYEGMHLALAIGKPDLLGDAKLRGVYREVLKRDAPPLPVVHAFYSAACYVHECQIPGVFVHGATGSRAGVAALLGTLTRIGSDRRVMLYGFPSRERPVLLEPEPPLRGGTERWSSAPSSPSSAQHLTYLDPRTAPSEPSGLPGSIALIGLSGDDLSLLNDLEHLFSRLSNHGVLIVSSATTDSTALRRIASVAEDQRCRVFFHRITASSWIAVKQATAGSWPRELG